MSDEPCDVEKLQAEIKTLKTQRLTILITGLSVILVFFASMYQTNKQFNQAISVVKLQGIDSKSLEDKKINGAMIVEILKSNDQTEIARRLKFLCQIKYLALEKNQIEELNKYIPERDAEKSIIIPGSPNIKTLFDKMDSFLRDYKEVDVRDDEHAGMSQAEIDRLRQAKQRLVEIRIMASYLKRMDLYKKFEDGLHSGVHMVKY